MTTVLNYFRDDLATAASLTFLAAFLMSALTSYTWLVLQYNEIVR